DIIWLDTFWVIIVQYAYCGCLIARVPVLENLISSNNQSEQSSLILLFVATITAESLISCYSVYLTMRLAIRIRSMLQAAIFRKITRLSPTSRSDNPPGYVVTVMGIDCMQLSMSLQQFPPPLVGLTCMPVVFYLLAARVGTGPALCCAAWLLVTLTLPFPTSRLQNAIWRRIMKCRDDRLKRFTDLLSSVRLVKMYAWEDAYMKAVNELRDKEMVPVFLVNLVDGLIDSLYSASSSVMVIILFGTLAVLDPTRTLSASLAFSCVYTLSLAEIPTNGITQLLRMRSLVSLGMTRIIKLCTEDEQEEEPQDYKVSRKTGEIVMEKCAFAWTKRKECVESPTLHSVSLDIAPGSLVGVAGFVGSGKSSFLSAILGDMHCIEGTVRTAGRISYVPQVACVYNMTVRDNILFGEKFDSARYASVLRACELLNDINKFPAGDLTEVGEKGTTLSGGQKQRISLARAAYSRSNICLLDDPLSALDPTVAARVFKQVVGNGGLLKNQTRILVSNQGHILKHMDQLLLMHGKTVITHRSIADLVQDDRAPETLRLGANMPPSQMTVDASLQHLKSKRDMARGRVIRKEASSSSMGTLEVVWSLCKLSGFCVPIGTAFFIASAVALAWQQLWIKQWTDANSEDSTVDPHSPSWVKGLVALCLSDVLFRSVGGILFALSNRRLSMGLHNSMLSHVMHSPVPFFDSTPRARLLNRFTVDLESIDCRLYLAGKLGTQNILITLSRLSIIGSQTPPVLGVGVVAVILMAIGMVITVRASNSIRFKESTHVSKVLQHTTETIESLSTIRAYGAVERFCKHFCRLTDGNMRMTYGFMGCFRLTKVLTSLLGFVIVLATLISAALLPAEEDGVSKSSSVGLALSSSLAIPMSLMSLCMVVFNLFQLIVCFERCIEYTKLPKEEQVEKPKKDGDTKRVNDGSRAAVALSANESWPTEGRVEFKDYSTSYRPGVLPDVLKGVTFYVDAYEKVGVVGRTGAGKSSLVLALLRVLKATEGCIKIDGVDISQVPLRRLRSAVTVIPQDPILVRGSLRDNLDPTRSHTDEELWRALNQAHLGDLVTRHPEQLLLQTGDGGSNLSVGQRQLVCLARALIRMPRVLILDEATSQMDGDTDRLIQATLRESFVRCTVLAIAHRIHTVLDYDKILVMSDGSVLEYGSVTQLLSNPATMFRSMAQSAGVVPSLDSEQKKISRTKL
ncbi:ATP-binding cassette sub-family C member 3, partial [Ixodes scapularis]|uniref:ATP-binding cassette sub-family C member 3 n=1 Tax=Ixodes scapularis TaxID=6945 RepID=UPI001C38ABC5